MPENSDIPQPARELDIYVNQLTIKSIAVQRLQPKNKNYSFHRGWGLKTQFITTTIALPTHPIAPRQAIEAELEKVGKPLSWAYIAKALAAILIRAKI